MSAIVGIEHVMTLGSRAGLAVSEHDLWVMAAGVLTAVACGVLGCFLVLRKISLLGDAISHAILPGLVAAFLVTTSRDIIPMLVGAAGAGLLSAVIASVLHKHASVDEGASLGVSFTVLFALGVVLIAHVPPSVDLDPSCVFYGTIETVPWYTQVVLGVDMPRYIPVIATVLALNTLLIGVFWKELKLASFDAAFAASVGVSASVMHYMIVSAVAWTSVVSFEAVGSILVVSMLIAPGATAHLLTDRYPRLFGYAALFAASSALVGYQLASLFNTTAAGMMSVVAGLQFAITAMIGPRHGVLARVLARLRLAERIEREDILASMYRRRERESAADVQASAKSGSLRSHTDTTRVGSRGLIGRLAHWRLCRMKHIVRSEYHGYSLTSIGIDAARQIIRSHRMWESFLADEVGLEPDHIHDPSHRMEHFITTSMQERLRTNYADRPDPHGKPVPPT